MPKISGKKRVEKSGIEKKSKENSIIRSLDKAASGIRGVDDITNGGLPRGRSTLVVGGAGSGKTMFVMEFIVRGAMEFNEPGVFVAFEEDVPSLKENFTSMGYDLDKLIKDKKIIILDIRIDRSQFTETGEYDLEAMFIRLGHAIDKIGAKRVGLDTIEVLFTGLCNHAEVRSELVRLFNWLNKRGMTAVVTGECGVNTLSRFGLEEYIADCVIYLDSRVKDQISTRRLRIVKYRGSIHGMDEYPFIIGKDGIVLFPITSIKADYKLSRETVSTGIPRLDLMLGGKGFFRSSSVLYTGSSGSGKTSFAAYYANEACRRGERCLLISFEETQDQIIRNMQSIGLELGQWVKKGLLKFIITRPSLHGLETHLVLIEDMLNKFQPQNVIMDTISDFTALGAGNEIKSVLIRLQDLLKSRGITAVYTDLITGDITNRRSDMYLSSMIDTWILLRNFEYNGERNRGLTIVKSRGMPHSNQIMEFKFSHIGIDMVEPYIGPGGVLMGSAKIAQSARDNAVITDLKRELQNQKEIMEERQREFDAKITILNAQYKMEEKESVKRIQKADQDLDIIMKDREIMIRARKSDTDEKLV